MAVKTLLTPTWRVSDDDEMASERELGHYKFVCKMASYGDIWGYFRTSLNKKNANLFIFGSFYTGEWGLVTLITCYNCENSEIAIFQTLNLCDVNAAFLGRIAWCGLLLHMSHSASEPCRNVWTDRDIVGEADTCVLKEQYIRRGYTLVQTGKYDWLLADLRAAAVRLNVELFWPLVYLDNTFVDLSRQTVSWDICAKAASTSRPNRRCVALPQTPTVSWLLVTEIPR